MQVLLFLLMLPGPVPPGCSASCPACEAGDVRWGRKLWRIFREILMHSCSMLDDSAATCSGEVYCAEMSWPVGVQGLKAENIEQADGQEGGFWGFGSTSSLASVHQCEQSSRSGCSIWETWLQQPYLSATHLSSQAVVYHGIIKCVTNSVTHSQHKTEPESLISP